MAHIIERYIRLYMKPLTNIIDEASLYDGFYREQIKYKIHKLGFPAEEVVKVVRDTPDTYITGSFLLHYLLQESDWKPGDIDIFTTDPDFHKKLEPCMKSYEKGRYGAERREVDNTNGVEYRYIKFAFFITLLRLC